MWYLKGGFADLGKWLEVCYFFRIIFFLFVVCIRVRVLFLFMWVLDDVYSFR